MTNADNTSRLIDLAALVTELNKLKGKAVPDVTLAEVRQHVADGDLVSWLKDGFEGKISDEHYRALMWLAGQVGSAT
jgi:hypothetical protein